MTSSRSVRFLEGRLRNRRGAEPDAPTWIEHHGSSMAPALHPGDRLRVMPLDGNERVSPGEIVLARRGALLVAHRLVACDGKTAITRGDGNDADDPELPSSALCGRVVEVERGGRRFVPAKASAWRRGARWLRRCFA